MAMQAGTFIISKQSGCAEILSKCIKVDYWDIDAMADAMYALCVYPSLHEYLQVEGKKEVDGITWRKWANASGNFMTRQSKNINNLKS